LIEKIGAFAGKGKINIIIIFNSKGINNDRLVAKKEVWR
jgi:hypothetical protein